MYIFNPIPTMNQLFALGFLRKLSNTGKGLGALFSEAIRDPSTLIITLTLQNLLFCRVPIKFILGFIIRTYKKVGFGRSR